MAICHFRGTVISRSQGRSAVACAAYRSAEKLYDEKYDRYHDYIQKQDVANREILLPDNAPSWMGIREKLWNAVEKCEKRKDAQLAREFNFALPREMTIEQNTELAREFVKETFVKRGMVVDLCIHNDKQPDGQLHPHAHVMLTLREVRDEGFGKKVRVWNSKEMLLSWRCEWAEMANHHLALNGHDIRIDHRTLLEQGITLEPQYKIGAAVARDRFARMEDHQRIARENGNKILGDPSIALHAITRQQSTFTHQDIARFVNRHTADIEQFNLVYEKVKSSPELVSLGVDDKNQERLTTNEMFVLESKMMAQAVDLSESHTHTVRDAYQEKALFEKKLTAEQKTAFDHVVGEDDLTCVVGYAGTGKSYLLGAAREAWEAAGYNVLGVTLSGIAAENLEGSSGIASRTIASRSYYWDKGEELLTSKDVLVIDEAGMIGSRQMGRLLDEAHTHGAKVVLVGDTQQLQAIEAGASFRAIAELVHYVELTDIRRQKAPWQADATRELAKGQVDTALSRYDKSDHVHVFDTSSMAKNEMVSLWNDARLHEPDKTQIMLAYTRVDVSELNDMARALRRENGELGNDTIFLTSRGERAFAEEDRIYFLKNDRSLGVLNGTLGTIKEIDDQQLVVRLDRQENGQHKDVTINFDRYHHIEHGYAATIHKSQGVTVDRSYILASRYLDAHATYVGLSRHRESADLFWSKDEFGDQHDLAKHLGRDRAKDVTLDYIAADKEIDANQIQEKVTHHAFYLTDGEMKELAAMERRVGLTQDSLDEFKSSFYKEHPDLAFEADKEFDSYFSKEISRDKSMRSKTRPDDFHLEAEGHAYPEKAINRAEKVEKTVSREKEIELDLEL